MFEFLTVVGSTAVSFLGIYKILELFVRRKERLMCIDKMVQSGNISANSKFELNIGSHPYKFSSLRWAGLLVGLGFGLLLGNIISAMCFPGYANGDVTWRIVDNYNMVLGSSLLLGGGFGLLLAFFLEMKYYKKVNE